MEKEEIRKEAEGLISDLRKLRFCFQCFEDTTIPKEDPLFENVSQTIKFLLQAESAFSPLEKIRE